MADYRALHPESTAQDPKRRDVFYYDQLGNRMGSANVIASWGPDAVSFSRENNGLNQYVSWTRGPINQDDDMGSDWGSPGQANGVTMQEGWITASYNALNQPNAIWCPSYPGGALARYRWFGFDPLGRCVKRWLGNENQVPTGPTTYYYYDGWNLIQEGPGGTTADRTYVHGGRVDEIVASRAGGEWVYHHYDARGHCILLTRASDGTIREQYDYDAFGFPYFYNASGVKLGSTAQFGNRFLFTGREWLKELRVYDYRNRIYQPELGRFLQPDPTGFEGGDYNLYRYCHNDPVNKSDPMGLQDADNEDKRPNLILTGRGDWDFDNGRVAMAQIAAHSQPAPARSQPAKKNTPKGADEATIGKGRRILAQQTKEGEDSTGAIVDGKPVPGDHIRGKQVPYRFGKPVYAPSGNSVLAARKILYIAEPVPPGRSDLLTHHHTRTGFTSEGVSLAEPSRMDRNALKTTGAMLFSNPYLKAEGAYRIYRNGVSSYETRYDLYDP